MGRHLKKGLDYFNIDCVQEDNLNYLEAKHGVSGYGVLVKLWRKIYMVDGYYCEWSEKNQLLFCKDVGIDIMTLSSIIETCFVEGIFDRSLFEKHGVLTSSGVQKRWIRIVTDSKRKDCQIDPKLVVSAKTPEEKRFTPEEIEKNPEESTQSKVKKSKGKERKKEKRVAPALPAPPKVEDNPEEHWQVLVDSWFSFVNKSFGADPSFAGRDPKLLKEIVQLLKKRAAAKQLEWTEANACKSLNFFLACAFAEEWLSKHFSLENIRKQFDQIFLNQVAKSVKKTAPPVQKIDKNVQDIEYLYARYQEDQCTIISVDVTHFDFLVKTGKLDFYSEMQQICHDKAIVHLDEKKIPRDQVAVDRFVKKFAVLEYFAFRKHQKFKTIFDVDRKSTQTTTV